MSFQTRKSFVRLRKTIEDILDENWDACDCPIDCQVINTVKAQKTMKDIVKIVHLPSVVQLEYNEATRTLFLCSKKTTITIRLLRDSIAHWSWRHTVLCQLVVRLTQNSIRCLRPADTLQNGAT